MQKIAVKCPVLRREGPMEQWNNGTKKRSTCFVTIDPIAFAEFFERNVFFLLITLPRFNVPDDLSHHGQGTTSLQYIDTRWLFRGWRDHAGHLGCWAYPMVYPILIPRSQWLFSLCVIKVDPVPFLYIKLVPFCFLVQ